MIKTIVASLVTLVLFWSQTVVTFANGSTILGASAQATTSAATQSNGGLTNLLIVFLLVLLVITALVGLFLFAKRKRKEDQAQNV